MRCRFGEFVFDDALFTVSAAGTKKQLQPKEFDVLGYLLRHRGRVVSKDELFESIWPGVVVSESALTQVIKNLRAELGDTGHRQTWIETVRCRGYRFVGPVAVLDEEEKPRAAVFEEDSATPSKPAISSRP